MKSKTVNNGITNVNTSVNTDVQVQQNGKELIGKGSISNIRISINEKFRRSLEKNRKWIDVSGDDNDDGDVKRNRSVPDGNGKENEVNCLKDAINQMQRMICMKDNEIEKLKAIICKRECVKCSGDGVRNKIEMIINKYNGNTHNNESITSLLNEIKCAVMEE